MSHKRCFPFLLLLFTILLVDARVARACSCAQTPTVFASYEWADVVVIVKVVGVEKKVEKPEREKNEDKYDPDEYRNVISTKAVVEKVYKGSLKAGDEMIFAQGGGADCIWTFAEKNVGNEYLFYLKSIEGRKVWLAGTCGRSNLAEYATEDLLYLNKMDKVRGKTRISGRVSFNKDTELTVAGRKIRIVGAGKSYEAKTDGDGVFEIYDLPAGKYVVEPEVPLGWKVDMFWLEQSTDYEGKDRDKAIKSIPVILEDKKDASLNIVFEVDNAIRGRVYDPAGKPMPHVCIQAIPAQAGMEGGFLLDCTDENGNFVIRELPRGGYVLAVNEDGKISSSEPFKTFYYPNVFERERAGVLNISEGVVLDGINIYVPKLEETITIEGVFLYSDGKPVVDENVEFKAAKSEAGVEADASARTDAKGRFSIKILKGLKGKLYGSMFTYIGEFKNCPKLESIIKKGGNTSTDVATPALEIQAENNLYNVELKYPFPGCEKAKDEDDER